MKINKILILMLLSLTGYSYSINLKQKTVDASKCLTNGIGAGATAITTYYLAKVLFKDAHDYPHIYWSDEDLFSGELDPKSKLLISCAAMATAYVTIKLSKNSYDSFQDLFNLKKEKIKENKSVVNRLKKVIKKGLE